MLKLTERFKESERLGLVHPGLGGFLRQIKFRQHADRPVQAGGFPIQNGGQFQRIQRADAVKIRQDGADLVALQVADEIPADILRQLRRLFQQLLRPVFSKIPRAAVIVSLNLSHGTMLGYD